MISPEDLKSTVIEGGYCIGCGACAAVDGSPVVITMNEKEMYEASFQKETEAKTNEMLKSVCPFSNGSMNEDQLASEIFGNGLKHDSRLGNYLQTYAGFVSEGSFREQGSSGGMTTWMLCELMNKGEIDGVLHVKPTGNENAEGAMFNYGISTTVEEIRAGCKSRYYPVTYADAVRQLRSHSGKFAVVGIPCFIKSLRLLSRQDPVISERIKYYCGILCGHLKSKAYAEMLAWQINIKPNQIQSIDFRDKIEGKKANDYGVAVNVRDTEVARESCKKLLGTNWGMGMFKYHACDFCDDIFAETADIVFGDAWISQYLNDSRGTNVILVRRQELNEILLAASQEKRISLDELNVEQVAGSQRASLQHRREGLSYRLKEKKRVGNWAPKKRVKPNQSHVSEKRKQIYQVREKISKKSHTSFQSAKRADDFNVFLNEMAPLLKEYQDLYRRPLWRRALSKIKQVVRSIRKKTID